MPFGALRAASRLGEYTLVDRGTWYAIEKGVRERMRVFKEAFDARGGDVLLNPAHLLVGSRAREQEIAEAFAEWMGAEDGGQKVVEEFAVNGAVLHSTAPKGEREDWVQREVKSML